MMPRTMSDDGRLSYTIEEIEQAFEEALDDVHTRFILNLPPEELSSTDRIFFQLEQAWWFYDDFICDHSDIPLPRFKGVKSFALKIFQISPLLSPMLPEFQNLWEEFSKYKRTISTYGTILMNQDCTKVILCQVWNGKTWMFPAGKINQNEVGCDAGARETYEETGFDPNCNLGLTKDMLASGENIPWKTPLDRDDGLVFIDSGKRRTLYVCRGVPEDFPFEPVARKEVSAVEWHDLDDLPKKSFAVFPFCSQIKRWIRQNTGKKGKKKPSQSTPRRRQKNTTPGKKRSESARKPRSRNNSRGKVREHDLTAETGLAAAGEEDGWDEDAMFSVNEKLLGRKITYDGNPHQFAEKGFDGGLDPHAFHVVGGSFMNSGITKLAPAPEQSKLQPLFRKEGATDETQDGGGLQPFFSDGGETPWGEVVSGARSTDSTPMRKKKPKKSKKKDQIDSPDDAGQALLKILQKNSPAETKETSNNNMATSEGLDALFLTDKEITARSQQSKASQDKLKRKTGTAATSDPLQQWAKSLPDVPATETFGDFRFDVDAIMNAMNNLKVSS